jgi:transketolase
VLAHYGYIPADELKTFGAFQSRLGCHPDRFKVPGAELSTGSLGHGLPVAIGMALAFRLQNSPRRVFTVIGDGESNEGSIWEAVAVATHLQLTNLTVMLDHNRSQIRSLPIPNPAERFAAFGCDTIEADGHDLDALKAALTKPAANTRAVIAHTIKGHGCPTLANNVFEWHRKSPNPEQLAQLIGELNAETV